MKGTVATRILLLLLAAAAIAVAVFFAWPTAEPEQQAKVPKPSPAPHPPAAVSEAVDTLKSIAKEVGPKKNQPDQAPSFDVARIEPDGEAVIGGRAAPGATVELLRGGVTHARTVADPSGDFVIVPKPLPPGNYDLTLRATQRDGKVLTSKDSVAVSLRASDKNKPVVALVEPDKPAIVLSKPTSGATPALTIDAVEGEAGGKLYVSGRARPGAKVRLYLNDAYIASATASPEGRVAFSIRSGIKPGDYRVRLDQVNQSGKVQKRAEVPFKAPIMVAEAQAAKAEAPAPKAEASAPKGPAPKSEASGPKSGAPSKTAATSTTSDSAGTSPSAAEPRPQPGPSKPEPRDTVVAPPAVPPQPTAARTTPVPHDVAPTASVPKPAAPQSAPGPRDSASGKAEQSPPSAVAAAEPTASQPPAPKEATPPRAATSGNRKDVVVVPSIETTVVVRGDSLWRISRKTYGRGARYSVIYKANRGQIRNPDLIYPGQIFVLPKGHPDE